MAANSGEMTPAKAFWISIAIFVVAVIAVVVLALLLGPWLVVIALAVAFFGLWALLIYSLNRLSGE